jgi:hypothetical protein
MKRRWLWLPAAILVVVGVGLGIFAVRAGHSKGAIRAALAQEAVCAQERDDAARRAAGDEGTLNDSFEAWLQADKAYLESVRAIDLSSCPPEFVDAYKRYLAAYEGLVKVRGRHPDLPITKDEYACDMTAEGFKRAEQVYYFAKEVNDQRSKVGEQWTELGEVAAHYVAAARPQIMMTPEMLDKPAGK